MSETSNRLWVVHISNNAVVAARAQREGFICIGWTAVGNLAPLDTRERMKAEFRRAYPDWNDGSISSSYGQPFRFAHVMREGELVVYPVKGSREIMIGEISGPYRWAAEDRELLRSDYSNVRPVKWLKTVPRIAFSKSALHSFGSFSSVSSSDEFLEEVTEVLSRQEGTDGPVVVGPVVPRQARNGSDLPLPLVPRPATSPAESADSNTLAERAVEETKDYLLRQWARTGQEFEEVVAALFRAMGYTANTQAGTHDLGVDVVAHPDPLGVQPPFVKIQCKSGTGTVGAPAVKQLRGLLNDREKGVLIALGGFSTDARHVQQNDGDLILIDGNRFVELFLDHYERLAPEWRHRFPLDRVYVSAG
jgi:restriction system protein